MKFTALGSDFRPIAHVINEKAILNAVIGLLACCASLRLINKRWLMA